MSSKQSSEQLRDFIAGHCDHFHALSHCESLAVMFERSRNAFVYEPGEFTIYKYSVTEDQWSELLMSNEMMSSPASAFDQKSNTLYIISVSEVKAFNLTDGLISSISKVPIDFKASNMMLIGDKLHLIGIQNRNLHHVIIETSSGKLVKSSPTGYKSGNIQKITFSESTNSIIAYHTEKRTRNIWGSRLLQYSLDTEQWIDLKWSHKKRKSERIRIGMVTVSNGRYFLCFGGVSVANASRQIVIYDLKEQKARKSKGECPLRAGYHAVVLSNKEADESAVFGFIRRLFKVAEFRNIPMMPSHFIRLIAKWYCNEQVHLVAKNKKQCNHWRLSVDVIITA